MSLFRKIFGRQTVAELVASAEQEVAEGRFGFAKLEYEKALARSTDEAEKAQLRAEIHTMRDSIATARLDEADKLVELGSEADAIAEASGALDVAASDAIRDRARLTLARIRTRTARIDPGLPRAMTRDELAAEVTAVWSDEQSLEYEAYGEPAIAASIALTTGAFDVAHAGFEALLAASSAARWLHRDVARARWAHGDLVGADAAFLAFFEVVTEEEHDRALFEARMDRARLFKDRDMIDDALAEAGESLEHVSDEPRMFTVVARFLRDHGHATEAREILEAALSLPGSEADPVIQIELALAESDEGRDEPALDRLERVALALRGMGQESPRDVEAARARLLERVGRTAHAAELHKRLAVSFVDEFGFDHALESARLHAALGSVEEARHLLERASLLVGASEERKTRVDAGRASLDALGSPALDAT